MSASDRPAPVPPGARPAPHPGEEEVLIRQHRDRLRQLFPIPDADELRRRSRPAFIAPLLALVLLGGLLLAWDPPLGQPRVHATATAQQRTVVLADGSRVTLDAGSRVDARRHLRTRRVTLVQGRARFDVVRSHWRSFRVDAGDAEIRVLGTVFDVRRDGRRIDVTVHRGMVSVAPGRATPQRLIAGQGLSIQSGRAGPMHAVAAGDSDGWLAGRIELARTPLAEALLELQRHSRVPIVLDDPVLSDLPLSGVFDARRPDDALALLPEILPVQVNRSADGSMHVTAR